MQRRTKNKTPTMHEIAMAKKYGIKFVKMLQSIEQMLADGRIKIIERIINLLMPKLQSIIFLIIFIFKNAVIIKHIPNPQINEFIPINLGKNQIEANIIIAPKI